MHRDTIFALSTVRGRSGVALFRISGPGALEILIKLSKIHTPKNRYAHLSTLRDQDGAIIDECIVTYFAKPSSFTGEDVIEICSHGSIAVINKLNHTLAQLCKMAEPGEFSRRALLNGKMDLISAEGLSDLIHAETEAQRVQSIYQQSGRISAIYDSIREKIIDILAHINAYIEYPDHDLPENEIQAITDKVLELKILISSYLANSHTGEIIRSGLKIGIIGAPNVGKSTLLNHLAKREVAIVSDIAGTTRDTLEVHLDINGYKVTFVDTAGIRDTENPIEQEGVRRTMMCVQDSHLTIAMFDDLHNLDQKIKSLVNRSTICIASKVDHIDQDIEIFAEDLKFIPLSVHKNVGINKLMDKIQEYLDEKIHINDGIIITRERHRILLQECVEALGRFFLDESNMEIAAEELNYAQRAIEEITGKISTDDMLDKLFSGFCVGK